jgi:hypothetical protein
MLSGYAELETSHPQSNERLCDLADAAVSTLVNRKGEVRNAKIVIETVHAIESDDFESDDYDTWWEGI